MVKAEDFEEVLTGDFWLVMKTGFDAPRLYVRFRDGQIVCDRVQWLYDEDWVPMREGLRAALKKAENHGIESLSVVTLGSPDIRDGQTFAEWVHERMQGAGC